MSRKVALPSVFNVSFLDAMAAIFTVILLIYVLLLARLVREEEAALEGRFAVLAVRVVGLDAKGQPTTDIEVKARLELVVPPPGRDSSDEASEEISPQWRAFQLPFEEARALQWCCREVSSQTQSGFVYCVVRSMRPSQCLFRLTFYATRGEELLDRIRLEGWLAAPVGGKQPLSVAVQRHLSAPFDSNTPDANTLEIVRGDSNDWLTSALVLRAALKPDDDQKPNDP